ncbi:MAG: iron-containing alcohol dehydrogenase [Coriobacteriia bacterium]|nr:iron-containing alcohol dehydrogenase [Coriobacteriia bacterium]MCL2749949.1 iron-containing alcohol dehydrogenase [Coriobacteriia bacterium]
MSAVNAWYRTFQFVFNYAMKFLPWRKALPIEGAGAIQKIPAILTDEGVTKVMVVTDPGLMAAGVAPRVIKVLEDAGMPYELYSDVQPNPTTDTVGEIYELYKSSDCNGFVAIGGGSSMDAAKATAAQVKYPHKTLKQLKGILKVRKKLDPFIAVPTTAGTGSETTVAALITDSKTRHKYGIMSMPLIAHFAILDPELTLGLPPHITSTTGMDALTHAVEAYLCWTYNTAESKRFALDATAKIAVNLPKVYADGSDVEARGQMLDAAYKAGFAFTRSGVGNIHALAHALGGIYNTPHGLANAVVMPIVLEDYGSKVYKKLAIFARTSGIAEDSTPDDVAAKAFIQYIRDLNERMQIPAGFDFIKDEDIEQMITWALKEANPLYPVPVIYNRKRYRHVIEILRI